MFANQAPLQRDPNLIDFPLVTASANAVAERVRQFNPKVALILGSGWGDVANRFESHLEIPYSEINALGTTTIKGHKGVLRAGSLHGVATLVFQGRRHFYEGYGFTPVAMPLAIARASGAKAAVITSACGGIAPECTTGTLMMVTDHINMSLPNPLRGAPAGTWRAAFLDQSKVYSTDLQQALREAASAVGTELSAGALAITQGPSYESPAEIRALGILGASAVGMSAVTEAMIADAFGLKVCSIACISNRAAGLQDTPLSHEEVTAALNAAMPGIRDTIAEFWKRSAAGWLGT